MFIELTLLHGKDETGKLYEFPLLINTDWITSMQPDVGGLTRVHLKDMNTKVVKESMEEIKERLGMPIVARI